MTNSQWFLIGLCLGVIFGWVLSAIFFNITGCFDEQTK